MMHSLGCVRQRESLLMHLCITILGVKFLGFSMVSMRYSDVFEHTTYIINWSWPIIFQLRASLLNYRVPLESSLQLINFFFNHRCLKGLKQLVDCQDVSIQFYNSISFIKYLLFNLSHSLFSEINSVFIDFSLSPMNLVTFAVKTVVYTKWSLLLYVPFSYFLWMHTSGNGFASIQHVLPLSSRCLQNVWRAS